MTTPSALAENKRNYVFPLIIIGTLFFIFGFITWANSQLIPYLKIACELTDTQSYLVATAFFAAYFFMAIPSSYVLKAVGFKRGMSIGLLVMAIGALLFIPAANTRNYPLFLTGLFIIGTGLALLQTASNPYAAELGPMESAAKRISIMGICNKLAGIIAVYVLGSVILKDVDALKAKLATLPIAEKAAELDILAQKVVAPYIIIAVSLTLLAIILYFIKLPEINDNENIEADLGDANSKISIFQFPHLWVGVLALFFYVGAEVISYDTFARFGEALGFPLETAKNFASYTGYGLLVGYILSIVAIPKYISQQKALAVASVLSILLVTLAIFAKGYAAVTCFALLGFSNAVMWPAIFPLAIDGLGKFTKTGSALLIMAIVGGAVLPPLYASFSAKIGVQTGYWILIPMYVFILYFAVRGHKIKNN